MTTYHIILSFNFNMPAIAHTSGPVALWKEKDCSIQCLKTNWTISVEGGGRIATVYKVFVEFLSLILIPFPNNLLRSFQTACLWIALILIIIVVFLSFTQRTMFTLFLVFQGLWSSVLWYRSIFLSLFWAVHRLQHWSMEIVSSNSYRLLGCMIPVFGRTTVSSIPTCHQYQTIPYHNTVYDIGPYRYSYRTIP